MLICFYYKCVLFFRVNNGGHRVPPTTWTILFVVYMEKKRYVALRVAFVIIPVLPSKRYQDYNFRSKTKQRKYWGLTFKIELTKGKSNRKTFEYMLFI